MQPTGQARSVPTGESRVSNRLAGFGFGFGSCFGLWLIGRRRSLSPEALIEGVFVFEPFVVGIAVKRAPEQAAGAAPVVEHDPLLERLALGGDDDEVVLGLGAGVGFAPVLLEGFQVQLVQTQH